jgi:hypothetical protein
MKKIIVIGSLLLLVMQSVTAQQSPSARIAIQITDAAGKALPFASVLIRRVKDSTLVKGEMSNPDGQCTFENIPAGHYFIEASQMGYTLQHTTPFTIDAKNTSLQLKPISLSVATKNLQTVNVTAQKPFIERSGGKTILNVESSIAATGNSALDVLRKAPGVTIDKDDNVLIKGKQGVTIMIDGKLTYLTGEQLSNLLKSTPSESISQIEIITSPSAKYDAAGNSGIINIKTKKGKLTGMNGTLTGSIGDGWYPSYNLGTTLNWRTNKFNVFGNYDYSTREQFITRHLTRNINGEQPLFFDQDIYQKNKFHIHEYKAGFDYFITPKQTIGVLMTGYDGGFTSMATSETGISKPGNKADSVLNTLNRRYVTFNSTTYNLNYKWELDTTGSEITVDADYARFANRRNIFLDDSMYDAHTKLNKNATGIRNLTVANINIKSVKTDLTLALDKTSKLETGAKMSFVTTDNTLNYDSLYNGVYVPAITQSNIFSYKENILAAYGTYKKQFAKLDFQVGVRVEQTTSDGNSVTLKNRVKRTYVDLFPSGSVDYKFNDAHKLSLAFTSRINRPDYEQLNPFLFFLDKYTFGQGNPFLKPEYAKNTELSYMFKQKYIATLGYSHTKDVIMEYLDQNDETNITTSTARNFTSLNNFSLALTLPFDITKWWNSSNNLNFIYNRYKLQESTLDLQNGKFQYNATSNNTFTLPKDIKMEANVFYNSPFIEGLFSGKSQFGLDAGIQKAILSKKATFKFNVTDIFNTGNRYKGYAKYSNIDMTVYNVWQRRRFNFSVTYRFGNSEIKAARQRETGTSAEQKRAG